LIPNKSAAGQPTVKSPEEVTDILDVNDLAGSFRQGALERCDHKSVAHRVAVQEQTAPVSSRCETQYATVS
jgi:hypothetical protein